MRYIRQSLDIERDWHYTDAPEDEQNQVQGILDFFGHVDTMTDYDEWEV